MPYAPLPFAFVQEAAQAAGGVLLASSRHTPESRHSLLFTEPVEILTAHSLAEIPPLLARLEEALAAGLHAAGYFAYEAGGAFLERAPEPPPTDFPLIWLGLYPRLRRFDHGINPSAESFAPSLANAEPCTLANLRFSMQESEYAQKIAAIHEWIRSGSSYQANLTGKLSFSCNGSPAELFHRALGANSLSHCAFVQMGQRQILSFSPELFFRIRDGWIETRPMKGTAPRGRDNAEDAQIAAWLQADLKNRSENVMIVDLLRNDLGRICEFGTVRAEDLFAIERYETLFQMVSTVRGQLRPGLRPRQILQSLFPSGSITGAPKRSTMQLLRTLEPEPRGVYTGAIGYFAPTGEAEFNVAIRTLTLAAGRGEMGVGSGVTIDSRAADEYRECLLKAEFLTRQEEAFALIETMLWEDGACALLDLHLARLADSAHYFGFPADLAEIRASLQTHAATMHATGARRVRLTLSRSGETAIVSAAFTPSCAPCRLLLAPERVHSGDRFLYHKTTHRSRYNTWLERAQQAGCDEALFTNERGELTEGAISNIFLARNGRLLTPPIRCGLLPGVLRRSLLANDPRAAEHPLTRDDLQKADAIYLANALRGLRRVSRVQEGDQAIYTRDV